MSDFKVYTLTKPNNSNWTHWADGLSMFIQKEGVSIELNSKEVQDLVRSLPRTIGGSY